MSGALGNLEEILVSDWGRLSAAVAGAQGPWGISQEGLQQQQSVMQLGVEQTMWTPSGSGAATNRASMSLGLSRRMTIGQ